MTTTCEITVTVKRLVLQNLMLYITSKIPSAEFNPFRESDKYLQSVAISKDLNIYNIFNTKDYLRERKREIKFIFYLIEKKLKYELQKIFNFVFNLWDLRIIFYSCINFCNTKSKSFFINFSRYMRMII